MAERSIITDSVVLPAPAEKLFEMYLDAGQHAAITGHPVTVSKDSGAPFEAFDGTLTGTILQVVRPQLIVQSWRSAHFHDDDVDSTLVLMFSSEGEQGRIDLVHLDVPLHDYQQVIDGWKTHYWEPWQKFLASSS